MRFLLLVLATIVTTGLVGCGKGTSDGAGKNVLSGKVTMDGRTAPEMAIVVVGPEGVTAGGTTNMEGRYTIPDPPQGKLEFYFIPAGQGQVIPERYTKQGNDLTFDYTEGNKTYDIDLKQ